MWDLVLTIAFPNQDVIPYLKIDTMVALEEDQHHFCFTVTKQSESSEKVETLEPGANTCHLCAGQ